MAKYVLGDEGARKFKQLTKGSTGIRNSERYSPTHAIDNMYPHPYEVRWSESQISGGGYMIWLPPNCLQVDGENIDPEKWTPLGGKINNLSDDWWYRLGDKISNMQQPTPVDQLSSFDLYLYSVQNEALLMLSANETYTASAGFVHITQIDGYRSKPNVKSNLILGDSTREKPFNLVPDGGYTGFLHQWWMKNCIWEYNEKTIDLNPAFMVPAPNPDPSLSGTCYGLRLLHVKPDSWIVDEVHMDNENDLQTLNMLSVGYVLSPQQPQTNDVIAVYPLYILASTGGIKKDLREAWYIITDALSCDDVSITKDSNVDGDLSSGWKDKLRITGFHTYADETYYGNGTSFIVRQGGNGIAEPPTGNEYIDYLNVNSFKSDILQNVADTLSNDTSALAVDEQSVSKGGDGWALSSESGVQQQLHMWHFHDSAADVNNPEMCDIVLRYNPDGSASDQKWLRYISYEDLKDKLSSDIGGGGGGSGGEVTPDQLSAIPCWGMFAWTEKTQTIGPGGCMVGRQWITASGTGSGKADALYQVKVTISASGSATCQVVTGVPLGQAPTTTECWIPIYQISGGKIATDYRGAFVVPAFD